MNGLRKKIEQLERAAHTSNYESELILVHSVEAEQEQISKNAEESSNTDFVLLRLYVDKSELSSF